MNKYYEVFLQVLNMIHFRSVVPLLFITAMGCTEKDVEIGGTGPESDRTDELYERSRLLEVHVDIDAYKSASIFTKLAKAASEVNGGVGLRAASEHNMC
mgnify:CR=1 FL=1